MKKIILASFFLLFSSFSFACTCIGKGDLKKAVKNSDKVFVGVVISSQKVKIDMDPLEVEMDSLDFLDFMEYEILVTYRIKGKAVNNTIKIYTGFGNGDCGYHFKNGSKYIVFANYSDYITSGKVNFLSTNICMPTKIYNDKDFEKIKRFAIRRGYS